MDEIKEIVLEILNEMHPDVDFTTYDAERDGKLLDSFDVISMVADLNDEFDIVITADKLTPQNFRSADTISALISELLDED